MSTESDIKAFGNRTISDLLNNYIRLGLKASGEYGDALENVNTFNNGNIKIRILGAKQGYWMENGRQPNKKQSKADIMKWVGWAGSTFIDQWLQDKGIVANPFAVAYKIATEGWSVPNQHNQGGVISDIINDNWFKEGINVAGGAFLTEQKSDILKQYKKIK